MGLAVKYQGSMTYPVMTCDTCGEMIRDWRDAIVIYGKLPSCDGIKSIEGIYHKGQCDPKISNCQELIFYLPALIANHYWGTRHLGEGGQKLITIEVPESVDW